MKRRRGAHAESLALSLHLRLRSVKLENFHRHTSYPDYIPAHGEHSSHNVRNILNIKLYK